MPELLHTLRSRLGEKKTDIARIGIQGSNGSPEDEILIKMLANDYIEVTTIKKSPVSTKRWMDIKAKEKEPAYQEKETGTAILRHMRAFGNAMVHTTGVGMSMFYRVDPNDNCFELALRDPRRAVFLWMLTIAGLIDATSRVAEVYYFGSDIAAKFESIGDEMKTTDPKDYA